MNRWLDLLERSGWTFVEAFAAAVLVTGNLGVGDLKIAAGAAVIAVLKIMAIDQGVANRLKLLAAMKKRSAK